MVEIKNAHDHPIRSCSLYSKYVLTGDSMGIIKVWVMGGASSPIHTFSGHNDKAITALEWSPLHERFFASSAKDGKVLLWDVEVRDSFFLCFTSLFCIPSFYLSRIKRLPALSTPGTRQRKLPILPGTRLRKTLLLRSQGTTLAREFCKATTPLTFFHLGNVG